MQVHRVVAEQLGVAPLFTEGPNADLRYKFVLIEDELVYGNVRHHWDLVAWLLRGPLFSRYPAELVRARPIIEAKGVLTVFGGLGFHGETEMVVYITPSTMTTESTKLMVETDVLPRINKEEVA